MTSGVVEGRVEVREREPVTTNDAGTSQRGRSDDEDEEAGGANDVDSRAAASRDRTERLLQETDDLLKDIDNALLASLGLDGSATDDQITKAADAMVSGYVQKGGQ